MCFVYANNQPIEPPTTATHTAFAAKVARVTPVATPKQSHSHSHGWALASHERVTESERTRERESASGTKLGESTLRYVIRKRNVT